MTVPSVSFALAVSVKLWPSVTAAPAVGVVMLTVGGTFDAGLTVTLTGADVVVARPLSVAMAVSE